MVTAFFAASKPAMREKARKQHLATISGVFVDEVLPGEAQELRKRLEAVGPAPPAGPTADRGAPQPS